MTAGHPDQAQDDRQAVLLEAIVATGERAMLAELEADGPWDQRLRNCFRVLIDLIVEEPGAARVCLVDTQLRGAAGTAAVDRAARSIGRHVLAVVEESPARAGMPREVARAVLGGLRNVIQSRLHAGREHELPALAPQLMDWALGYRTPPEALRRPHADDPPPLLAASLSSSAADHPPDRGVHLLQASLSGCRQAEDWPHAIRDGLAALLAYLSNDPTAARLTDDFGWTGGLAGLERLDKDAADFRELLADGLRPRTDTPDTAAEAIGASVIALVHDQLRHAGAERLYEVGPAAAFTALAPAIGTIEACTVVNDAA
jgi:hypothetical protein